MKINVGLLMLSSLGPLIDLHWSKFNEMDLPTSQNYIIYGFVRFPIWPRKKEPTHNQLMHFLGYYIITIKMN